MDPNQQQQIAGMMAGMGVAFAFFSLIVAAFFIFCFWRIFTKAGLAGPLALIAIVPVIGPVIVLCILAFSKWNVVPGRNGYGSDVAPYPPQAYPPANYPPAGPPSQL